MISNTGRHQGARLDFNRFGILTTLDAVRTEQRLGQGLVVKRRCCGLDTHPAAFANRRFHGTRGCQQRTRVFVDQIAKRLRQFRKLFLRLLFAQCFDDTGAHLLQRRSLCRLYAVEANDVITEIGFHRTANLAWFHGIHRVFKRLHHHAAPKTAQAPSLSC